MDARRFRFFAALTLLVIWLASLTALAVHSAQRPTMRPAAHFSPR